MDTAARGFIGRHDFTACMASGSTVCSPVRHVTEAGVERSGDILIFRVRADGFLYNMVRIMTGTLLAVQQGRFVPEDIPKIIEGKNRKLAGPTAPACGLYLEKVFYKPQI